VLVAGHQATQQRIAPHRGVKIKLVDPVGQNLHQPAHAIDGHVAAPGQTETMIVDRHARRARLPAQECGPAIEGPRSRSASRAAATKHVRRLGRYADRGQAKVAADVQHQSADGRVQVHVLVRIRMVERETGCGERSELCADLSGKLPPDVGKNVANAQSELIRRELPIGVHEAGNLCRRQHSRAFDDHEVQADAQIRHCLRASHGVGRRRCGDHEARGFEDPVAVGLLNCFVDGLRQAEIVRRNDDAPHIARNSRPERQALMEGSLRTADAGRWNGQHACLRRRG